MHDKTIRSAQGAGRPLEDQLRSWPGSCHRRADPSRDIWPDAAGGRRALR